MAFVVLPNDHLELRCDHDCGIAIVRHRAAEAELLAEAEAAGWAIDRDLGLAYCPLAVPHDCSVCGAITRSSLTDVATGVERFYCDDCFEDATRECPG